MLTDFGQNLKNICADLHMTDHDLSQKLNVNLSYIKKIQDGKINPSLKTILKIADVLHISPHSLIIHEPSHIKKVGVLGGLGPDTTAEFYISLIQSFQKRGIASRPPIIITNIPLPLSVEREFIINNSGSERYLPFLIQEAQRLERAGCDFIVMPCNSLHIFIENIRSSVKIPVLSIVEEFTKFAISQNIKSIGIIATAATREHKLYEKYLHAANIQTVSPDALQQAKFGKIIHNLVSGTQTAKDRSQIMQSIDSFAAQGVHSAALACTDLQLLLPEHKSVHIYDTMQVFAESTVNYMIHAQ